MIEKISGAAHRVLTAAHDSTDKMFNRPAAIAAMIGGAIAGWAGGWDALLSTLCMLMVVDYITGVIRGIIDKKLSSRVGFTGILKKVLIYCIVILAAQIQAAVVPQLPLREMTIMFFVANEGLSILENAGGVLPLPQKLKDVLVQLRAKDEKEDTEDGGKNRT